MLITNYDSVIHTFYCYNHIYIQTIRDCFLLSFLTCGTIFWSVWIDSVWTWVTWVLFQRTYDPSAISPPFMRHHGCTRNFVFEITFTFGRVGSSVSGQQMCKYMVIVLVRKQISMFMYCSREKSSVTFLTFWIITLLSYRDIHRNLNEIYFYFMYFILFDQTTCTRLSM